VQIAQGLLLLGRGALGHHACGVALQQAEQVVHVAQVFLAHLRHIGATAHLHRDEAFGGQHLQRFAQRRAADAEFFRNLEFVNPAARLQLAAEDALAQLLGNFFVQGFGREGDG